MPRRLVPKIPAAAAYRLQNKQFQDSLESVKWIAKAASIGGKVAAFFKTKCPQPLNALAPLSPPISKTRRTNEVRTVLKSSSISSACITPPWPM